MAQMPGQQRRRGRAVDVVIAEDRDLLAARGRVRDALRRRLHLRHGVGIGHQFADGRIEKILDRVDLDVAARPAPAPASPAIDSAARSPAPAPRRAHRAGRATAFRSPNATTPRNAGGASTGNADAGSVMMLSRDRGKAAARQTQSQGDGVVRLRANRCGQADTTSATSALSLCRQKATCTKKMQLVPVILPRDGGTLNQSLAMIPDKGVEHAVVKSRRSAEDRQPHKD